MNEAPNQQNLLKLHTPDPPRQSLFVENPSLSPLRRLFAFAHPYRRDAIWATIYSVLNKIFDVLPELLIGVAVDVVVNRKASFLARQGLEDPLQQLYALVALTIVVWVSESLFEYRYAVNWRGLAQNLQHELRQAAYAHLQRCRRDGSSANAAAG